MPYLGMENASHFGMENATMTVMDSLLCCLYGSELMIPAMSSRGCINFELSQILLTLRVCVKIYVKIYVDSGAE